MAFVSFAFSYVTEWIGTLTEKPWTVCLTFIWYACFPVVSVTAGCTTKDVLFTTFALLEVVWIYRLIKNREILKGEYALWAAVSWFAVVLRSAGIYIFIVFSVILFLNLDKDKKNLFVKSGFCVLMFWCLYAGPFYRLLDVQPVNKREMLSIPVQQLARVYNRGGDIRPDEREELFEILPREKLEQFYEPRLSDPMKGSLKMEAIERDPRKYGALWLKIGIRNAGVYISSFLDNTLAYWYPDGLVDGYTQYYNKYHRNGYELYRESSYFAPVTEPPGERDSRLPVLESAIMKLMMTNFPQKIPLVSMLFSPGLLFWILLGSLIRCMREKKREESIPLLFILLIVLFCFAGPIALIRYCLILFYALPVTLMLPYVQK
ncbi:hypothetical protein D3Z50_07000 [Clostridiaceae bacterium]|nr:hypothetical protein [Clostridiaceae bacterium]